MLLPLLFQPSPAWLHPLYTGAWVGSLIEYSPQLEKWLGQEYSSARCCTKETADETFDPMAPCGTFLLTEASKCCRHSAAWGALPHPGAVEVGTDPYCSSGFGGSGWGQGGVRSRSASCQTATKAYAKAQITFSTNARPDSNGRPWSDGHPDHDHANTDANRDSHQHHKEWSKGGWGRERKCRSDGCFIARVAGVGIGRNGGRRTWVFASNISPASRKRKAKTGAASR